MSAYLLPALLVVVVAEAIISARWYPPYFGKGVLIYRRRLAANAGHVILGADRLREECRGRVGPSLAFRELTEGTVAFREALLELSFFTYTPVMRGLLRYDPRKQVVTVEGRANWFSLAFSVSVVAVVWESPGAWPVLLFLAILLSGIYAVQAMRFGAVGRHASGVAPSQKREPGRDRLVARISSTLMFLFVVAAVIYWFTN